MRSIFCRIMFTLLVILNLCHSPVVSQSMKLLCPLRIFGGEDENSCRLPYVVRLERNQSRGFKHACTGTALTPVWTLTAGHCLTRRLKSSFIRYGSRLPKDEDARIARVLKFIRHGSYRNERINKFSSSVPSLVVANDVLLLKTEPILISMYGRLSAVDYTSLFGQKARACGYGNVMMNKTGSLGTLQLNKPLQLIDVMISRCTDHDLQRSRIFPAFCLAKQCGDKLPSTAPGDSGAPL